MKKYRQLFEAKWLGEVRQLTLVQWSELVGKPYKTLYSRLHKYKWSFDIAIHTPVATYYRKSK